MIEGPTTPNEEYELEYFATDGLKLTSSSPLQANLKDQGLEIVVEEDMPIYYLESPSDYELSETPYSSQRFGDSSNRAYEHIDESSMAKQYDSAPSLSQTQNIYKSFVADFNPLNEIHASWQDTILEASFEEDVMSSASSKKIKSALVIESQPSSAVNIVDSKKGNRRSLIK